MEFSLENLPRTVQLPTQEDLAWMPGGNLETPWKAVALAVKALGGTRFARKSLRRSPDSGERFFRTEVTINLPGDKKLVVDGDGCSWERATIAANLHALAKLRDVGLLTLSRYQPKVGAEEEKQGILDVYNYAARYRCIPRVSSQGRGRIYSITIEMPEHNIYVVTRSVNDIFSAEMAAAREFKRQAELYHLSKGTDTVIVKDRHALSTDNAADFFAFCDDLGEKFGFLEVVTTKSGEIWRGRPVFKRREMALELDVGTRSKMHTVMIAKLVGAVSIVKMKPHLLDEFSKALRAGNGKYLSKLKPEEVVLSSQVLQELKSMKATKWPKQQRQNTAHISNETSRAIPPKHALTPEGLATKSSQLRKKMDDYKTRDDLEHLRQTRSELPMAQYACRVRQIVHDNVYCVIIGATGSGKTTQVPQILLDQAIESGTGASCNVICTQPRRIAAMSVARRVAGERGEQLQDTVGYHVRFDAKLPKPDGSILYCTTGILLQQIQHSPDEVFDHASHLVIDEVHERDIVIDFLLTTLKNTMAARAAQGKRVPHVVLMSATIDAEQFAAYFRNSLPSEKSTDCPTLSVPGRTFPVQEYYLEDVLGVMKDKHGQHNLDLLRTDKATVGYLQAENSGMGDGPATAGTSPESVIDWKSQAGTAGAQGVFHADNKDDALVPVGLAAATVAHVAKTTQSGAILVFFPGLDDIQKMDKLLRSESPLGVDFDDENQFKIIMLHSSIPDSQNTVFDPLPQGCRKIILSTNIAETSITIPDVRFVIDTGKSREKRYDQTRRLTQLQCTWISKSNAKQRAGRAGRVQDGVYYALFTKARHESMRAVGVPELLRSDLQETCLDVKVQAFKMPVADFLAGAIEPPPPSAVGIAMQNLVSLGALTKEEELTPLGRVLALLPVHPTLGKMIVLGIIFRCLDPMIILGAAAHERPLFISPLGMRAAVNKVKRKFAGWSESDHLMLLEAFAEARQASARGPQEAHDVFHDNFIHHGAFKSIDLTARQIVDILTKAGLIQNQENETTSQYGGHILNQHSGSKALIKALLVSGLYPNFAVQTKGEVFRTSAEKDTRMHPGSVNDGIRPTAKFFTYNSLSLSNDGNSMFLRDTSSVTPLMVLLFGGPLVQRGGILEMDQWLPMFIKGAVPGSTPAASLLHRGLVSHQVFVLRRRLDNMLARAFKDLAAQKPLSDDRIREVFALRIARILNTEGFVAGSMGRGNQMIKAGLKGDGVLVSRHGRQGAGPEMGTAYDRPHDTIRNFGLA